MNAKRRHRARWRRMARNERLRERFGAAPGDTIELHPGEIATVTHIETDWEEPGVTVYYRRPGGSLSHYHSSVRMVREDVRRVTKWHTTDGREWVCTKGAR